MLEYLKTSFNFDPRDLRITPLTGYGDQNFLIEHQNEKYILKVSNHSVPISYLEFENQILQKLVESRLSFKTPAPVSMNVGVLQRSKLSSGARLFHYIDSKFVADYDEVPKDIAYNWAKAFAEIDQALSHMSFYPYPYKHPGHDWDLLNAAINLSKLEFIENSTIRNLVKKTMHRYLDEVLPYLLKDKNQLPRKDYIIIHGDANERNVMCDESGQITGVIDFGDITLSLPICELGVACAYGVLKLGYKQSVLDDFTQGFESVFKLTDLDKSLLLDLIKTRLAVSLLFSHESGHINPSNTYATSDQERVFELLNEMSQ